MTPRPCRLVLVGTALADITMVVDHLPVRGSDLLARAGEVAAGAGFNVLVAAARLGLPVAFAGRVGGGLFGQLVEREMRVNGIELLISGVAATDTGFCVTLVEPDGERTFVTSPGCEATLSAADLSRLAVETDDAIYISGYDLIYPVAGAAITGWLATLDTNHLVLFDPGPLVADIPKDRLQAVLQRTDLLSLSRSEVSVLAKVDDIEAAARALVGLLSPRGSVIVRDGHRGCWVLERGSTPRHEPAVEVIAIDSTGAGDAHIAGLVTRLAAGDDITAAARYANVVAALSVMHRGPSSGPSVEAVAAFLSNGAGRS